MNNKLLVGIIAVLGIALTFFATFIMGVFAIPTWIYLVFMVLKRKTSIFHNQMEPKTAERHLKRLKAFLSVAGISCLISIASIIVHNVGYGSSETHEPISFYIGLGTLYVFIIATGGGLAMFLKGRQKTI